MSDSEKITLFLPLRLPRFPLSLAKRDLGKTLPYFAHIPRVF
jgi:hypothetical protein